jgi:hypothetical protein
MVSNMVDTRFFRAYFWQMFGLAKLDFVVLESKMSKIAYICRERERETYPKCISFQSRYITCVFRAFSIIVSSATHDFEV